MATTGQILSPQSAGGPAPGGGPGRHDGDAAGGGGSGWPGSRAGRAALAAVAALAACTFAWGIQHSVYHPFYAGAVRSMAGSWKAFLYGSFDPGNTITLDKAPGFLWPQALAVRLLGFHPWVVTLPQVLEGIGAVLVLHRVVARWAGTAAGLAAAALFAATPAVAGLFRTSVEDPAFTLLLLLAAGCVQRAARTARLRTLLLAGLWVGLAFQAKMLEAWVALPVLAGVYLVSAPVRLRRRLGHLLAAGALTLAVSASWMAAVAFTPSADRPYVDGTTDNSVVSMVVGYNFLNRFAALGISAADTGSVTAVRGGGGGGGGGGTHAHAGQPGQAGRPAQAAHAGQTGQATQGARAAGGHGGGGGMHGRDDGWAKLAQQPLATQTGWLYPFALVSAACGLLWRRRRPRTDPQRAGWLLWAGWFAVFAAVFSAGSVAGHVYYMGVVAAPLAALSGAGLVLLVRTLRERDGEAAQASTSAPAPAVVPAAVGAAAGSDAAGPTAGDVNVPAQQRGSTPSRRAWVLPVALALNAAWCCAVLLRGPGYRTWVVAPLVVLAGAALLGVARRWPVRLVGVLAAASLLAAPVAWTSSIFGGGTGGFRSVMGAVGPQTAPAWTVAAARTGAEARTHRTSAADSAHRAPGAAAGSPAGTAAGATAAGAGAHAAPVAFAGFGSANGTLTPQQQALYAYLRAHRDGARYLLATTSWSAASPYILATGADVLPMGGFTGLAPSPTPDQVRADVASGALHYVLLPDPRVPARGLLGPAPDAASAVSRTTAWVRATCTLTPTATPPQQQLYRCGH